MFSTKYIFLVFYLCYSVGGHALENNEVVKISLYYESLCPACQDFIKNQLHPGYLVLGDVIDVDLVPYGNAYRVLVDGKWEFSCQHGPDECYGNKLEGCVLNQDLTQAQKVGFIGCLESSSNPASSVNAQSCALDNNIDWPTIDECSQGEDGDNILAYYGNITDSLSPALEYVPHIRFNDEVSLERENSARVNFILTVCQLFTEKPDGCN